MSLENLHGDWLSKRNTITGWNDVCSKDCLRIWDSICLPLSVSSKANIFVHKDLNLNNLQIFLDQSFAFLSRAHDSKTFHKKGSKRRAEIKKQFDEILEDLFVENFWQECQWKWKSGKWQETTLQRVFPKIKHYFQKGHLKSKLHAPSMNFHKELAEKIVEKYGFLSIHCDKYFDCGDNLKQLDEALEVVSKKLNIPENVLGLGASLVFHDVFRQPGLGYANEHCIAICQNKDFLSTFFHEWTHYLEKSIINSSFLNNSPWSLLKPLLSNLSQSVLRRSVQIPKVDIFLKVYDWIEGDLTSLNVEKTPQVQERLNQFVVEYVKSAKLLTQENKHELTQKHTEFLLSYSQDLSDVMRKNTKTLAKSVFTLKELHQKIEKNKTKKSVYAINALYLDQRLKKIYLSKPTELLARSGEMFFGQLLDQHNDWQSAQTITCPQLYPHALDRIRIVSAFERLLEKMKEMPSLLDVCVSPPVASRKVKM